jgi:hypothetical protein
MLRGERMSKTLEELGYKIIFHNEDRLMYRKDDKKKITFTRLKNVAFADVDMEELKAIYKYCEDNKWI